MTRISTRSFLKVSPGGRFRIDLHDDGSLDEWAEDDPSEVWHGAWRRDRATTELVIGPYTARLLNPYFMKTDRFMEGEEWESGASRGRVTLERLSDAE